MMVIDVEMLKKAISWYEKGDFSRARDMIGAYRRQQQIARTSDQTASDPRTVTVIIASIRSASILNKCLGELVNKIKPFPSKFEILIVRPKNLDEVRPPMGVITRVIPISGQVGPSEARNIGAYNSISEWLLFLDDDSELLSDAADILATCGDSSLFACRGRILADQGNSPLHFDLGLRRRSSKLNTEGALLIRKNIFELVGGFDPLLFGHEGNDLTTRLLRFVDAGSIRYEPSLLIRHPSPNSVVAQVKNARHDLASRYVKYKITNHLGRPKALLLVRSEGVEDVKNISDLTQAINQFDFDVVIILPKSADAKKFRKITPGLKKYLVTQTSKLLHWFFNQPYSLFLAISDFSCVDSSQISAAIINHYAVIKDDRTLGWRQGYQLSFPGLFEKIKPNEILRDWQALADNRELYSSSLLDVARFCGRDDIIIISFYTGDEYYSRCAVELQQCLSVLGVAYDISRFEIAHGENWPNVCRKKIQFYYKKFLEHRVQYRTIIWMDVDCTLKFLPSFIFDIQCDFMAFRRGFPNSKHIKKRKSRTWEPCFLVFSSTDRTERFLGYASEIEIQRSEIQATDDYFLEEAWRKFKGDLVVSEIPGEYCSRGIRKPVIGNTFRESEVFFKFGESGAVAHWRGKVLQHAVTEGVDESSSPPAKTAVDDFKSSQSAFVSAFNQPKKYRNLIMSPADCLALGITENQREVLRSNLLYSDGASPVSVFWWTRPAPGNMGDWLSPYIVSNVLGVAVKFESRAGNTRLIALGSIAKFAKETDTVWGAGISSLSTKLTAPADYLAVRGPHTADALIKSGGRAPSLLGDPGIIMPQIFAPKVDRQKGRYALVRHFVHRSLDLRLSDSVLELDILMSSPEDIENFIRQLLRCHAVVTSSLHVLILCVSYGIPCRLINLDSFGARVHGDGVKYRDFFDGVSLKWRPPAALPNLLTSSFIDSVVYDDRISTGCAVDLMMSLRNWYSRMVA